MKKKPVLRAIAIILIVLQLADLLAGCSFQKKPEAETLASTETETGNQQVLNGDSNYYEVTFDYPAGTSQEDASEITLPQKMMFEGGTLIYAVPEPNKAESVFAGWYYDAALTKPAAGNDSIEKNMTLYPHFVPAQNYDDEFQINYISTLDVEPDFEIRVAAKGLSESEVKDLLRVWNLGKVEKEEEFVIEPVSAKAAEGNADDAALESLKEEGARARDILARVKAAGKDARAIAVSELISLLLPEQQKALGISGMAQADLTNLNGVGDQIMNLESMLASVLEEQPTEYYVVRPVGGKWRRGDMHQVEILDTTYLRFYRNGEETGKYVVYYNITVHQDNFNNMKLNSEVVFLPYKDVEGVSLDLGLFSADADMDGEFNVTKNDGKGVMTYSGSENLSAGITVAVYDGILHADQTVDGSVGYFKITKKMGSNQYAYESADFTDVVFMPDIIPVRDDGSFQDGDIFISSDQLKFTSDLHKTMGLDANTVVEAGDFLAVYTGNLSNESSLSLTGYGCITSVVRENGGLRVHYDVASEDTVMQSSDSYMQIDNVPISLTEEELNQYGQLMQKDMEESGFFVDASEYVKNLITEDEEAILPDSKYASSLKEVIFQTDDGGEMTLEEVRKLAAGSKVEVSDPKLSFLLGLSLQHFDGTGIRAEAAAEMTITIHMNDKADIEIKGVAMIEMEVALGLHCKWEVEWRKKWIFPYIYDISGSVGLHAGIYVGAGITITVVTKMAENDVSPDTILGESEKDLTSDQNGKLSDKQKKAFEKLGDVSGKISALAKTAKKGGDGLHISDLPNLKKKSKNDKGDQTTPDADTDEMHNTVGGSFEEKYAAFLQDSDAEYVPLIEKELIRLDLPTDPMHILAVSLGINFVVKLKINVMLGASITYGNGKQITANFTIFHPSSSSEVGDLETPNFQVDFYVFGMIGVRVGVELDLRIGAISTLIASIGVTAEIGVYLEFFGFFYVGYKWVSGKGSSTEMFGSLLAQLGLYLEINFKAQMGNGKLQKKIKLYEVRWPLLSLGSEFCALDFEIGEDDDRLNIDIKEGASAKVPDDLFNVSFLKISTGDLDTDSMDRNYCVDNGSTPFTSMGVTCKQYDEANFHVSYKPLGKNFGTPTKNDYKGRFQYDPVTNTITARPETVNDKELWGEFTFTWYQGTPAKTESLLNYGAGFGLNTRVISRTVRVHWKGVPVAGTADVYLLKERQECKDLESTLAMAMDAEKRSQLYYKKETIPFDGFDGITYFLDLENLSNKYPGYALSLSKETYDETAYSEYMKRLTSANLLVELIRGALYGAQPVEKDPKSRGWWLVFQGDQFVFFKMHQPETKAMLFFNFCDTETDWHVLNEKAESSKPLASAYEQKIPTGETALDQMPANVKNKLDETKYDYEWYMYSAPASTFFNGRNRKTREVVYDIPWFGSASDPYRDENGKLITTNMPAFSEFIGNKKSWIKVTEDTKIPMAETVFFAIRKPKTFNVTWSYDEGDETTQVRYGEKLSAPKAATRTDYDFQGWYDENGKQYSTMPANDLTLYPKFRGGYRTVTWILDGYSSATSVKAGDNPIDSCPFRSSGNVGFNWMTEKGNPLSMVTDAYEMPNEDITLYGVYVYQCDWLLYDSGNGQYVSLATTYRQQASLFGEKVLSELPDEVKRYMTDNRYEFSVYRYGDMGTDKVKAGQSQWREVNDETTFEAGNASYILRRAPIMVKVTWKYDDGDVVTTNWVGRKLTAPKEISRAGSTFLGWMDSNGRSYDYPPRQAVTLYPQFSGHEHTWDEGTVTKEATCNVKGEMTYQCTGCGRTRTEEIPFDLTKHVLKTEKRNEKAPGCTEDGSYDDVTFCEVCGAVISSETKSVAAIGHQWGAVTYEWSADNKSVTAKRVCQHDEEHVETETVKTTGTVELAATCEAMGKTKYVASFKNTAFAQQTKTVEDIAALGHKWGSVTYVWTADNKSVTATRVCQHNAKHVETETVNAASSVAVAPTCETKGKTKYVASFKNTAFTQQTKTVEDIAALGHDWNGVTYVWSTDNKTVTATRTCKRNAAHKETETVNAASSVAVAPTCETKGKTKYVASFDNKAFAQQTKTVEDIAALGHEWGEPGYVWSNDNKTVTATRVCQHNSKHKETETVSSTSSVAVAPTCETKGKTKYVASFDNKAFTQQTKTVEDIAALGHDWNGVTYVWSTDNKTVTATRTCKRNAAHKETETVNVTTEVVQPTCEAKGKTTYVATFNNKAFVKQTKALEDIAALGHDWGDAAWNWSGYASATATFTCKRNEGHKQVVNATITSVRTEPTLTSTGSVVYTAKVTFNGKTYQDQVTEILPKISTVKLGSEQETASGEPALGIDLLQQKLEDYETDSLSLSQLDPGTELWLWAYVGESIMDENRVDIEATMVWAEDYKDVKVENVQVGAQFKIRIIPVDTTKYNECVVTLTIIAAEPEEFTFES